MTGRIRGSWIQALRWLMGRRIWLQLSPTAERVSLVTGRRSIHPQMPVRVQGQVHNPLAKGIAHYMFFHMIPASHCLPFFCFPRGQQGASEPQSCQTISSFLFSAMNISNSITLYHKISVLVRRNSVLGHFVHRRHPLNKKMLWNKSAFADK